MNPLESSSFETSFIKSKFIMTMQDKETPICNEIIIMVKKGTEYGVERLKKFRKGKRSMETGERNSLHRELTCNYYGFFVTPDNLPCQTGRLPSLSHSFEQVMSHI